MFLTGRYDGLEATEWDCKSPSIDYVAAHMLRKFMFWFSVQILVCHQLSFLIEASHNDFEPRTTKEINWKDVQEKIRDLLGSRRVVLFMKGTPESPECGFSAKVGYTTCQLGDCTSQHLLPVEMPCRSSQF
eukprot:GHVS01039916.1.p1 GENE.GHVS01039916.1~~GHVS01039916.1.p1  ORF type:complete len:131 (+),score=11.16 GHVS01039916.1:479-871(+)